MPQTGSLVLTGWAVVFRKQFKRTFDGKPKPGSDTIASSATKQGLSGEATDAVSETSRGGERSKNPPTNGSQPECRYHSGHFNGRVSPPSLSVTFWSTSAPLTSLITSNQIWSCCKLGAYNQPCKTADKHQVAEYKPGELERLYRYYQTPAAPSPAVRRAVAGESLW